MKISIEHIIHIVAVESWCSISWKVVWEVFSFILSNLNMFLFSVGLHVAGCCDSRIVPRPCNEWNITTVNVQASSIIISNPKCLLLDLIVCLRIYSVISCMHLFVLIRLLCLKLFWGCIIISIFIMWHSSLHYHYQITWFHIKCQVFMAGIIPFVVLWILTACNLVSWCWCFGGTCCLYLQVGRIWIHIDTEVIRVKI